MRNLIVAFSLALTLLSPAYSKSKPVTKDQIELQTEYGPVVLQNLSVEQDSSEFTVKGTVTNKSSRAWRSLGFVLTFRDKSGRELRGDFDTELDRKVSVDNLGKGETKSLSDMAERVPAKLAFIGLRGKMESFDIQWAKEYSFYDSHPIFRLTKPAPNEALAYEDDSISIAFEVTNEQLQFTLGNKTEEPQSINWDEVSYVDLSGTAHRVLHGGVKLADKDKPLSPTVIPPGAKINDLIVPSDGVRWSSTINDWEHDPLLPPSQKIVQYKGGTFGVFMPIMVNGTKKNYTFTIRIEDVQM